MKIKNNYCVGGEKKNIFRGEEIIKIVAKLKFILNLDLLAAYFQQV